MKVDGTGPPVLFRFKAFWLFCVVSTQTLKRIINLNYERSTGLHRQKHSNHELGKGILDITYQTQSKREWTEKMDKIKKLLLFEEQH